MSDSKRADIVRRVTRVLADADDDPQRLWAEPLAWVHVTEIPEGNWGAMGRVVRFEDIAAYVLTGTTDGAAQTTVADAATMADATPTDGAAQTTVADVAATADATPTDGAAQTTAAHASAKADDATTTAAAG
jgi:phenylpyruvate tautomerase PptA (4-oxalocrotonate tautomerase family)